MIILAGLISFIFALAMIALEIAVVAKGMEVVFLSFQTGNVTYTTFIVIAMLVVWFIFRIRPTDNNTGGTDGE